jgi:hypothetical protein
MSSFMASRKKGRESQRVTFVLLWVSQFPSASNTLYVKMSFLRVVEPAFTILPCMMKWSL